MVKHLEIYRGENEPEDRNSFLWLHTNPEGKRVLEEYNGVSWQPVSGAEGGSSGSDMVPITYEELKAIRDEGKLVPGQQYRITDYHCITAQENTRSADHQFDIIVTADDEKTLNENARAIQHEITPDVKVNEFDAKDNDNDTWHFYWDDAELAYCCDGLEFIVSSEITNVRIGDTFSGSQRTFTVTSTDVEYFANCNLAAWELKYSIDNDKQRFAWAKIGYDAALVCWAWGSDSDGFLRKTSDFTEEGNEIWEVVYPSRFPDDREDMASSDLLWMESGDGERRYAVYDDGQPNYITFYSIEESWRESWGCYVDQWGPIMCAPQRGGTGVIYYMKDEWNNECPYDFKNIQFKRKLTDGAYAPDDGDDTWVYTFNAYNDDGGIHLDATLLNHTWIGNFGCVCKGNVIKEYNVHYGGGSKYSLIRLNDNVFLNRYSISDNLYLECHSNNFGNNCHSNTFDNECYSNNFGNFCHSNTFGTACYNNTFEDDCLNNTFGGLCYYNTFGYNFSYNTFGMTCGYNTFGDDCGYNTFGNSCSYNTLRDGCKRNAFESNCSYSTFDSDCCYNTFGSICSCNTFGSNCYYNTLGSNCRYNTFGSGCKYNTFASNSTGTAGNYFYYNKLEDGVGYCILYNTRTASKSQLVKNYYIKSSVVGTSSSKKLIEAARNLTYDTTVSLNSSGELKIYCEADLAS